MDNLQSGSRLSCGNEAKGKKETETLNVLGQYIFSVNLKHKRDGSDTK